MPDALAIPGMGNNFATPEPNRKGISKLSAMRIRDDSSPDFNIPNGISDPSIQHTIESQPGRFHTDVKRSRAIPLERSLENAPGQSVLSN